MTRSWSHGFVCFRLRGGTGYGKTILCFQRQQPEHAISQEAGCSGTQSSRRVDAQIVEILRTCANGDRIRFVRRLSAPPNELVLEVTEPKAGGRSFERNLVLQKLR